ncbi:MAG: hypothetical protein ACRC1K_03960 [Planctomycetia bacterium]
METSLVLSMEAVRRLFRVGRTANRSRQRKCNGLGIGEDKTQS